jgi:NADH:ubiquinone oxidoreductase subunit 6 (subunit J)
MSKEIPPIYKEKDFEYIDIVLMLDNATKRLDKSRRTKTMIIIALFVIFSQIFMTIGVMYYYEKHSKKSTYEVMGERFYEKFNSLDEEKQLLILKTLKNK